MADDMSYTIPRAFERGAWLLLLAVAGFVPLFVTNTSLFGDVYGAWTLDAVSLPKSAAIMVLAGLGLAMYCIAVTTGRAAARWGGVVMGLAWALVVWTAISAAASPSTGITLFGDWQRNEGLAAFAGYAIVLTLTVQVVTGGRRLETLASVLVGSGTIVAAYGVMQYGGADPFAWPEQTFGTRMFGTFGNPDLYAAFLVMPLVLAAGLALASNPGTARYWFASVAFLVIGTALLLSFVRGAWIGGVVGLVVLGIAVWRGGSRLSAGHARLVVAGAVLAVAVGAWTVFSPQEGLSVVERAASAFDLEGGSVGERIDTWRVAARAGLERPVVGYGPDTFVRAFRLHADESWWSVAGHARSANNAHSLPIQYWVTIGIPGVVIALTAVVWALAHSFGNAFRRDAGDARLAYSAMWAGVVALAVTLLSGVTTPMVVVWLWLGMGAVVAARSHKFTTPGSVSRALASVVAALLVGYAMWGLMWLRADNLAAQARTQADLTTAIRLLDVGIEANPLPQQYRLMRGGIHDAYLGSAVAAGASQVDVLDAADRVIDSYRMAVQADPTDALASIQLLHAYNQRYELAADDAAAASALRLAESVGAEWPDMPDVRNESARAHMHVDDLRTAEEDARAAVSLDPAFAYAWLTLGEVLERSGRAEEAAQAVGTAVELDPSDPSAVLKLEELTAGGGSS